MPNDEKQESIKKFFEEKKYDSAEAVLVKLLKDKENDKQIKSWIRDQYEHPVESLHTIDEVLKWFDDNKIEFINSIPKCNIEDDYGKSLFEKSSKGTYLSRFFGQISMLFNELGSDGGLFIVIGKKK